jgi:hypothetical protein
MGTKVILHDDGDQLVSSLILFYYIVFNGGHNLFLFVWVSLVIKAKKTIANCLLPSVRDNDGIFQGL